MKTKNFFHPVFLFWPLASSLWLLFAGCSLPEAQSDRARYYTLAGPSTPTVAPAEAPRIGLYRVEVPDYLHPRAIAIRRSAGEIHYQEDDRWAEPLDAGIARVLRERLAMSAQVVSFPFSPAQPRDFEVRVRIESCEGTADGGVNFSATFEILTPGGGSGTQHGFTAPPAKWDGKNYARLAELIGADASQLADAISAALPKKG